MPLIKKGVGQPGTRSIAPRQENATREVLSQTTGMPPGTAMPPATKEQDPAKQGSVEVQVLAEGTKLQGRYVIEGILGVGGMSVVYRGRDLRFKDVVRHCAIKEMYQRSPDSQTRMLSLKHFEREAGLLATLSHPAIPKVYDFFEENVRFYLVQEMVPGKDLETLLEKQGKPFEEARVGKWALEICDVLTYLHSHKPEPIVFRDMKPSNILLTPDDRIVLIDFGIARLIDPNERKGTMIGTEGYAPPEQYRGMAEPQGDIYALGATMHHLLTGNDPRLETPFTFHERPITTLNPTVSAEMEALTNRALTYDMAERWATTADMKQALLGLPSMQAIAATQVASPTIAANVSAPAVQVRGTNMTELVWDFTCEEEVRSSPYVTNDLVFVGSYDNNLYAIGAMSGDFCWKFPTEGGVSSSPTVWQDIAIVGSEDGSVYGIDARNGSRRWVFRTEKPVRSSPRVQERVVFIGSDDQHFYALDGLRGVLVWKFRAWMPFRSSACPAGGFVYFGCDDSHIYCLEIRTSALKWKQRTQKPIFSTPYYHEGLVYVGSSDSHIYALDGENGMVSWKFRTNHSIYSSPTVVQGNVIVGSADGNMYALEKKKGRLVWKFATEGQITSSPFHYEGRIYFGATDNHIYCIRADNGSLVWKYETDAPVVSSPMVINDIVYVGCMDSRVYALRA